MVNSKPRHHFRLFNQMEVKAAIADNKCRITSPLLPQPPVDAAWCPQDGVFQCGVDAAAYTFRPATKFEVGDSISVKEELYFNEVWRYAADDVPVPIYGDEAVHWECDRRKWTSKCPPGSMPKWAARFHYEVVSTWISKLLDIDGQQAVYEIGHKSVVPFMVIEFFLSDWDRRFPSGALNSENNPWVQVVEIKRVA